MTHCQDSSCLPVWEVKGQKSKLLGKVLVRTLSCCTSGDLHYHIYVGWSMLQFFHPIDNICFLPQAHRLNLQGVIQGLRYLPNKTSLKQLDWHLLERSRLHFDTLEVFKCVKGTNKGDTDKVLRLNKRWRSAAMNTCQRNSGWRRMHANKWFTNRAVNEWNNMSSKVSTEHTI